MKHIIALPPCVLLPLPTQSDWWFECGPRAEPRTANPAFRGTAASVRAGGEAVGVCCPLGAGAAGSGAGVADWPAVAAESKSRLRATTLYAVSGDVGIWTNGDIENWTTRRTAPARLCGMARACSDWGPQGTAWLPVAAVRCGAAGPGG